MVIEDEHTDVLWPLRVEMFLWPIAYVVTLGLLVLLGKLYFWYTSGVCVSDVDLSGKVIVITGGNTGIGFEYVRDMVRRQAKVIMACRNVHKAQQCAQVIRAENRSGSGQVVVEQCDLSSLCSVQQFCKRIHHKESQIDYLVCFAAATGVNPDQKLTPDGLEIQFQCNYLSHFLMIHCLMDLLRRSARARIILTSSSAHLLGSIDPHNIARLSNYTKHPFMTYSDSKLALVMLAREMANRLATHDGITVNSFHPGTVYTDGIKHNQIWYLKYFLSLVAFFYGKSNRDGAQTMIYLTVSEQVAGVSGHYFADCAMAAHSRLADDKTLRHALWNLSVDLIRPFLNNTHL